MKELIIKLLANYLSKEESEIEDLIEIPPNSEMGDFAFPCFSLAKDLRKNPAQIAQDLSKGIKSKDLEKIEAKGPYLNFFLDKSYLAQDIIKQILSEQEKFGRGKEKDRIMIEFPSPNTNKPLHLGHLRNISLGESVSRIFEFEGNKIIRANLNNDRGVHICKSMLAYQEFGKNKKPDRKSDHFVGDFYVLFSQKAKDNPEYETKAQEMLKKWEGGDRKILTLWKKMNKWALDGFKETYKLFGLKFDKEYYESKIYTKGRKIVEEGFKKGIFQKRADGAVFIDLRKEGLDEKILLRPDGTSVYMTQDLYLAKLKDQEFKLDGSIYVVANEQDYHFKVLFLILKKLGYKFADKMYHLSYGMVELPEGKMKSREGTVVDADDLIKNVQELAKGEIKERYPELKGKELEERSLKIALSALKYSLLKVNRSNAMLFNPKEEVSFEGDTGPYIQYSYARASSIIRKSRKKAGSEIKHLPEIHETELIKKLAEFPEIIQQSYKQLNPAIIANYSFQLAQIFNEFYHACPVINSPQEEFRLALVAAFKIVVKSSFNLLGIDVMEEM